MYKIAVFCFFGLVAPVSAIVVQDYVTAEAAPSGSGLDLDWGYVYNYKGSSAVAVGGGWILTAGHVADDGGSGSLTIGTNFYQQQEIVYYDDTNTDLALVRFDKAFPGYYPLYTDHFTTLPTLEVIMVGFGHTGTVSSNQWTMGTTGGGVKRWGRQVIDSTGIHAYNPGGDIGYTDENRGFWMNFNLGNTTNEAGVAVGDSGGGVFYNDNGIWRLTGIITSTRGAPDSTFAIAMPEYADWITATIPEPATTGMMGLSLLGLYFARSTQRCKRHIREKFFQSRTHTCDSYSVMESGECVEFVFWNQLIEYKEHISEKAHGFCDRISKQVAARVDRLLDKVKLEKRVAALKEKKDIISNHFNKRVTGSLDAFLIKVSWDRKAMLFRRFRQSIRRLFWKP